MGGRICGFLICVAAAAWAFPASSQDSGDRPVPTQVGNPAQPARLPYMAEFKTTQVRRLPDGSTITDKTSEVVAVDKQGRRMTATTRVPSQGGQTPATRFTVFDPMVHATINWVSPGKEATVAALPISAAMQCAVMSFSTTVFKRDRHGKMIPDTKTTQKYGNRYDSRS